MKDLFAAFGSAVFFPLVSLVLPGLTAIAPWFVLLMQSPSVQGLVSHNHTETSFVLMLISVFVGIIIDDLGMRLESLWLDRKRDARTKGLHFAEWWEYLSKPFEIEPSGRRHLRTMVLRLKFELGVPVALLLGAPGIWLNVSARYGAAFLITFLTLGVGVYLLIEAASTHEELGTLRHELLQHLGLAGRRVRDYNGTE
jgi:hypothetical protein